MHNEKYNFVFARKIVNTQTMSPAEAQNEIRAIHKLCMNDTHPNIVKVFKVGKITPFRGCIDMELCDATLDEVIWGDTVPQKSGLSCFRVSSADVCLRTGLYG